MTGKPLQNRFSVVGILGGGQLAQMLSQAAYPLGITTKVLVNNQQDVLPGLAVDSRQMAAKTGDEIGGNSHRCVP
jgi:phosphoribosylaminoimidazole carboxylase (NCAIR synthetase)